MSEFLKRKLAEHEAIKQSAEQERQQQWREIKARAPEMAEFLQLLSAAFGKVRLLSVELKGDRHGGK